MTRTVRINRDRRWASPMELKQIGGALGVLAGIEVMRTLNDAGTQTLRDIEIGFFTEEEGVRRPSPTRPAQPCTPPRPAPRRPTPPRPDRHRMTYEEVSFMTVRCRAG